MRPDREYEQQKGLEAAARQRLLAEQFHSCCGEWRGGAHHIACPKYVEPVVQQVADGQENLF